MKTKTKPTAKVKVRVLQSREKITNTTMAKIGRRIGKILDLINDPKYKDENFRQILSQSENSFSLAASNPQVSISFSVELKGGLK